MSDGTVTIGTPEVSLDTTTPPEDNLVSLDTVNTGNIPSPAVAASRAYKAQLAASNVGMPTTYDEAGFMINSGQETDLRNGMAAASDRKNAIRTQQLITGVASQLGRPLTDDENNKIISIAKSNVKADPASVIEDNFAQKSIEQLDRTSTVEDTNLTKLQNEDPEAADAIKEAGSLVVARHQFATKVAEDAHDIAKKQSWGGWFVDKAKELGSFGLYGEIKGRSQIPGTTAFSGGVFAGQNLEEQRLQLWRMPYSDFKKTLTDTVNKLKEDNPSFAADWAEYMVGKDSKGIALANAMTVLNATVVGDVSKVGVSLLKSGVKSGIKTGVKDAAKDTVETAAEVKAAVVDTAETLNKAPEVTPAVRAAAAGDIKEATVQKLVENVRAPKDPLSQAREILPAHWDKDIADIKSNVGRFTQDQINQLEETYATGRQNLLKTIEDVARVQRIPGVLGTEAGVRAIVDQTKDAYPGLSNAVWRSSPPYQNIGGTGLLVDHILGRPGNMGLFFKKADAAQFAKVNGLIFNKQTEFRQGLGYGIKVTRPVNETGIAIRDNLLNTAEAKSPGFATKDNGIQGWVNSVVGGWRTPEDTLSVVNSKNRQAVTYGHNRLKQLVASDARIIEDMVLGKVKEDPITGEPLNIASRTLSSVSENIPFKKNKRWNDWNRMLKDARTMPDPDVPGEKGYFFKSPGEIDTYYQKAFGRQASFEEVKAYFAYKRIIETDRVMRNLAVYRNKARLGTENHTIIVSDPNGGNEPIRSPSFDGVVRKTIGGEDSFVEFGSKLGEEKMYDNLSSHPNASQLRKNLESGRKKVIEFYSPEERPLAGFGNITAEHRPRYAIIDTLESQPISWDQVPRRGGGHWDYDHPFYLKQPKMRAESILKEDGTYSVKNHYEGDTTFMALKNRVDGQDIAEKLNQFRLLAKSADETAAKAYAEKNLGGIMPYKDLKELFEGKFNPETKVKEPGVLSYDHEFRVVPKDKLIGDLDKRLEDKFRDATGRSSFVDGTKRGSLARLFQVAYTGQRDSWDLFSAKNIGSRGNPVYKHIPADMVDPLPSMNRAMQRILDSTFMDDYKISSVEHWIAEAEPYLKAGSDELKASPFFHFAESQADSAYKTGDWAKVQNLKNMRNQIRQFIGMPSTLQTVLKNTSQILADQMYKATGPKVGNVLLRGMELAATKDPVKFLRGMTFHEKLGLGNIPQFFVQQAGYVSILGTAGLKYAVPGTYAAFKHSWGRVNPRMLDAIDEVVSKMNIPGTSRWKLGEFKEAYETLAKSGFNVVGDEFSLKDSVAQGNLVRGYGGKLLDAGLLPFNKGEKSVRLGAWYTAFREFRDANPTTPLGDAEIASIRHRADLLNNNMSRASSSALHQGVMAWPGQFLAYQLRQFEIMFSPRITWQERGRLIAWNAAIFGGPGAGGLIGFPAGDYFRKWMISEGYQPGDNLATSALMEGLPAFIIAMITGKGDPHKGNWYNLYDRVGNTGLQWIKDFMRGDKPMWELFGGATISTVINQVKSLDPFIGWAMNIFRDPESQIKLQPIHLIHAFKELSSVNAAWREYMAVNTGKWMTKSELSTADVSILNSAFMSITGLSSSQYASLQNKAWVKEEETAMQKEALKQFSLEFRRSLRETDKEKSQELRNNAFAFLRIANYPTEDYSKAMSIAVEGQSDLIDKVDWSFAHVNVPENKKVNRNDALMRSFELQNGKK
jgi:hypothetical protein